MYLIMGVEKLGRHREYAYDGNNYYLKLSLVDRKWE